MFISGMVCSGRVVVGFVYGSEFLTQKYRILFGTLLMLLDGMTVLLSAIYFDWISKYSVYFESIALVTGAVCVILNFLFIPESPLWLLKKGKVVEA
jgi:hypothetical protein